MSLPANTPHSGDWLEEILDKHAEYYIRQTMKFFQEHGESPALSKNNKGDLEAKQAILSKHKLEVLEGRISLLKKLSAKSVQTHKYSTSFVDGKTKIRPDIKAIPVSEVEGLLAELENERSKIEGVAQ